MLRNSEILLRIWEILQRNWEMLLRNWKILLRNWEKLLRNWVIFKHCDTVLKFVIQFQTCLDTLYLYVSTCKSRQTSLRKLCWESRKDARDNEKNQIREKSCLSHFFRGWSSSLDYNHLGPCQPCVFSLGILVTEFIDALWRRI